MNDKTPPTTSPEMAAALERVRQARAAVGRNLPLMSGSGMTAEQKKAFDDAREELASAERELQRLGGSAQAPNAGAAQANAEFLEKIRKGG